jgi:hypothetical protein
MLESRKKEDLCEVKGRRTRRTIVTNQEQRVYSRYSIQETTDGTREQGSRWHKISEVSKDLSLHVLFRSSFL